MKLVGLSAFGLVLVGCVLMGLIKGRSLKRPIFKKAEWPRMKTFNEFLLGHRLVGEMMCMILR